MKRFLLLLGGTLAGVLIGAWYGWSVSPVTYTETSPDQLSAEYQADYVLMVAETYSADHDLGQAAVRLSRLGQADLAGLVRRVADAYTAAGYPAEDCARLNDLARDLARSSTLPTAAP
jgi:uridylate kinase